MGVADLVGLFEAEYLHHHTPWHLLDHRTHEEGGLTHIEMIVQGAEGPSTWKGQGNGPLDAAWHAMRAHGMVSDDMEWRGYSEHSTGQGSGAAAMAWIELGHSGQARSIFGAGRHANLVTACVQGLIQAVNRTQGRQP